jgi:hypothetical protein
MSANFITEIILNNINHFLIKLDMKISFMKFLLNIIGNFLFSFLVSIPQPLDPDVIQARINYFKNTMRKNYMKN